MTLVATTGTILWIELITAVDERFVFCHYTSLENTGIMGKNHVGLGTTYRDLMLYSTLINPEISIAQIRSYTFQLFKFTFRNYFFTSLHYIN